ncbi:MauE/DoxX family redox-associated membrane protein [Pseudohongiella sp.]|uniref:Methylamine utilisation protein MauE domain-containing protein n=1 Tax=marine sediment metagenome TaxID=412755 RepID=A0A0F9WHB0_9ZZZZ|nr:MauE/DoxX family redox-associated membrane protein [Pseudohongiella sp.]HDZ08481.1 methylamine utilization protein MauE [Pseudohongiella sp.]HEA61781.1 methylamine utilization protein MauE [Pseudohongiella sp.]
MMIDPLVTIVIATSLALLFLLAARHKISAHRRFEAQLAAYRILPESLVSPAARVLPWLEIAVAASLLFATTRPVGAVLAATLLATYALAMGINLSRGRSQIDCGCGDTPQSLSGLLVLRNCVLAIGALLLLAPVATRPLNALDMLFAVLFVAACSLSYTLFEQLSRNHTLLTDKE